MRVLLIAILLPALQALPNPASAATGAIAGHVVAAKADTALPNATVRLLTGDQGRIADSTGRFFFERVPEGEHTIRIEYVGYEHATQKHIRVIGGQTTTIEFRLKESPIPSSNITVLSERRAESHRTPGSVARLTQEEMRRAPAAFEDVVRAMAMLPSVTPVSNFTNTMIVRGGNPTENGFYVDNIEVPDISHLSSEGSTGGPLAMINMDLVRDVRFFAGGFDASYGEKLSSVTDISLREGRRDRPHGRFDVSATGAIAEAEGPLPHDGSFIASFRQSFLDKLLEDQEATEGDVNAVPRVQDFQGKVTAQLSPTHSLIGLVIVGNGALRLTRQRAEDGNSNYFGNWVLESQTVGAGWRAAWSDRLHSQTSLAVSGQQYDYRYYETRTRTDFLRNNSNATTIALRNTSRWQIGDTRRLDFGFEAKHLINWHDYRFAPDISWGGVPVPELSSRERAVSERAAAYTSHTAALVPRLTLTTGLRLEHFTYTGHTHVAPRAGMVFKLSDRTTCHGAAGIYYQNLPLNILSQSESHRDLRDPVAYHTGVGIRHDLSPVTQVSCEFYYKRYHNMPLDPYQPRLFILDEVLDLDGYYFMYHPALTDDGVAYARGIELTLQAAPTSSVRGLVAAAWSRSRYRDYYGTWRDRIVNTRYSLTFNGEWRFAQFFGIGINWDAVGGRPYTPFDIARSRYYGSAVFDARQVNETRLDDYHSLSLRFDVTLASGQSSVGAYLGIWNLLDETNLNGYYWNETSNYPGYSTQIGRLVFLGVNADF